MSCSVAEVDPYAQTGFQVRCEWGPEGLQRLAPVCDTIVVVDVLSFTTAVDIVVGNGGIVLPYRWRNGTEDEYARQQGAMLAARKADPDFANKFSLSPASLVDFPTGERIVLPSPNGSTLCFDAAEAGASNVYAGCVRNASAVAAQCTAGTIGIIPAGERWKQIGALRPAFEDWVGAGAIIDALMAGGVERQELSPEARSARASFLDARLDLHNLIESSSSGRELFEMRRGDPPLAAQHDVSIVAPQLIDNELRQA